MTLGMRVTASLVALGLSACCSGSLGTGGAPVEATSAPEPSAAETRPPACLALCERIVACHRELGTTPRSVDSDCSSACGPEGVYGGLAPETWACSESDACEQVWACAQTDMVMQMLGTMGTTPPPGSVPADWPADFPIVPGGSPTQSPPMGPVHVAVIAYAGRTPTELSTAYLAELQRTGWTVDPRTQEHEEEAERFVAVRESNSVSVSIYRQAASTYVQTMQLGLLFGH